MRYIAFVLLAGCSSASMVNHDWTKEGATIEDQDRESDECQAAYLKEHPFNSGLMFTVPAVRDCMLKKGWQPPK